MDRAEFWKVIANARVEAASTDTTVVLESLTEQLEALDSPALVSFDRVLHELLDESYGWPLWGAAYLMCGGCGDDGFDYFRAWLILQGEAVYTAALASPDTIADVDIADGDYPEAEDLWYAADEVYEAREGNEIPQAEDGGPGRRLGADSWSFDDDEEMARRYPRLFEKYGDTPL